MIFCDASRRCPPPRPATGEVVQVSRCRGAGAGRSLMVSKGAILVLSAVAAFIVLSWLRPVQQQPVHIGLSDHTTPGPRLDSGFRPVELGGDDPLTNSDDQLYFRRHPGVKQALRRAIRDAMTAAEHNQSIDPLELLAEGLHRRGRVAVGRAPWPVQTFIPPVSQVAPPPPSVVTVPPVPKHGVKPANAWGPGPSPLKHKLPAKLPTRGMWPPVAPVSPDDPSGAYRSLGKLKHYRGGDLEQPGELKKAVEARSYNGELILTYGNEVGTAWIANLVFSLRASGIEHYLVIVMSDAHCKALSRPPWMISCAWSSWDFTSCKNKGELRRLEPEPEPEP